MNECPPGPAPEPDLRDLTRRALAVIVAMALLVAVQVGAVAQPIELVPDEAVETEIEEAEQEPEIPALELVDELREAPTIEPVDVNGGAAATAADTEAEEIGRAHV